MAQFGGYWALKACSKTIGCIDMVREVIALCMCHIFFYNNDKLIVNITKKTNYHNKNQLS